MLLWIKKECKHAENTPFSIIMSIGTMGINITSYDFF